MSEARPQAIWAMQVFTALTSDCSIVHWTAQVSYLEVYNEAFHDLLASSPVDLKLEEVRWVDHAGMQRAAQACSAPQSILTNPSLESWTAWRDVMLLTAAHENASGFLQPCT